MIRIKVPRLPWLALAASLPLAACHGSPTAPAAAAAPAGATIVAGEGGGGAWFEAPGQVQAVRQAQLGAQATGRVASVLVRAGEAVHAGQVLVRIDAPAARASADAGAAQAAAAATQLASARADFARTQKLHAQQYVSDAGLQRAEAQLRAVEAQATASEAQSRAARAAAGWEELRAPYDGRVTAVAVAAGDLALPGQPLVSMYAPGPMRVLADLPEDVAARLASGRPARLAWQAGACAGAPAESALFTLVPAIDAHARSVGVRIELPAAGACVPGALVRVALPVAGEHHALLLPRAALVRRGELDAAYVVDAAGRVSLRQLRLGAASGDGVEVLAGLDAGERVLADAAGYRP